MDTRCSITHSPIEYVDSIRSINLLLDKSLHFWKVVFLDVFLLLEMFNSVELVLFPSEAMGVQIKVILEPTRIMNGLLWGRFEHEIRSRSVCELWRQFDKDFRMASLLCRDRAI